MSSAPEISNAMDLQQAQIPPDLDNDSLEGDKNAKQAMHDHCWERSPDYRRLYELRKKGWESTEGDKHFEKQRKTSAKPDQKSLRYFHIMMQTIGKDMDKATRVFDLTGVQKPALLDMCMAPGGFVAHALKRTPQLQVRAMTLPKESGGHEVRLEDENVKVEFLDVTMLAADMGVTEDDVPSNFPKPHGLLFTKAFTDEKFDIAICGGAVVHTHPRPEWRERRESTRLTLTQLAISLEHLKPGGSMIILLHKVEAWRCFHLIHQFSKISEIKLFKHRKHHGIRSAFYFIAKKIRADSAIAQDMVAEWKQLYKVATLGTGEEYYKAYQVNNEDVRTTLGEFGQKYLAMAKNVWKIQADSLERAPFIPKE